MQRVNRPKAQRHSFTLIEMLAVIALASLIMGAATGFFYKGGKICSAFSDKAQAAIECSSLKKAFRSFVHENGELFLVQSGKAAFKNGAEINCAKGRLSLIANGATKNYALPKTAQASLALENEPGQEPCLALRIDSVRANGSPGRDFLRIAAAVSQNAGAKDEKAK